MNHTPHLPMRKMLLGRCGGRNRENMLDYDYAEELALKEAEKYAYKATENVPAKQQKEAYNQIKYFIQIGIRLMRTQIYTQEMVED